MKKYSVFEVFTPASPAKEAFVARDVADRLVYALRTPGKQVVIFGHSGSGKSTLVQRKLYEVYENHITTSCIKGMSFESVLLDAFDQLDVFYSSGFSNQATSSISAQLKSSWAAISVARGTLTQSQSSRVLPPQLTVQNMARFAGEAKACWVLEDFHKLDSDEKTKLSQAMKMFMDLSPKYPDIKSVAIGAVATAREVVEYDKEMSNRVAEIEVKLMTHDELREIIRIGADKLNLKIGDGKASDIVKLSNGLPSICHQICLNCCLAAGINETTPTPFTITSAHLDAAVKEYVETSSDSIRSRFDKAVKVERKRRYDNYGLILHGLSTADMDGLAVGDLCRAIQSISSTYPVNNIGRYLTRLQTDARGAVIRLDSSSGKYSFSDPFIRSYALAYFERKSDGGLSVGVSPDEIMEIFKQLQIETRRRLKSISKTVSGTENGVRDNS